MPHALPHRLVCLALLLLAGCAAQEPAPPEPAAPPTQEAASPSLAERGRQIAEGAEKRGEKIVKDAGLVQTATQPLNDLNLLETRIPPVLTTAAQKGAYAEPANRGCPGLQAEIQALNEALGPDIDVVSPAGVDPGLAAKAADQAVDLVVQPALSSVRNTVNYFVDGVIPFRSWVRKLSGAERVSNEVNAAVSAGTTRRHFLKGWARAAGCELPVPLPVAPQPMAEPASVLSPAFNSP